MASDPHWMDKAKGSKAPPAKPTQRARDAENARRVSLRESASKKLYPK